MKLWTSKMKKKGKYEYIIYRCFIHKAEFEKLVEISNEWRLEKVDKERGEAVFKAVLNE